MDKSQISDFPFKVAPFESAGDVLRNYGSLFVILCMRYLRINIEKVINDAGGYNPRSVAISELIETVSGENSELGEEWLNNHKVPTLKQCNDMAIALREYIRRCTDLTVENSNNSASILPIELIKENFQLTELELYFVLSCALIQYDERYAHAWRYVTGAGPDELPTAGFLMHLLDFLAKDELELQNCLEPESALRRYGLINVQQVSTWGSDTPIGYAPVSVPNRIVSFIQGGTFRFIPECCHLVSSEDFNDTEIDKQTFKSLQKALQKPGPRLALIGYKGSGRTAVLHAAAQKINMNLMVMNLSDVASVCHFSAASVKAALAIVLREVRMQRAILLIELSRTSDNLDTETENWLIRNASIIRETLKQEAILKCCVLLTRQNAFSHEVFGSLTEIRFSDPTRDEQPRLWEQALTKTLSEDQAKIVSEVLAKGYCLSFFEMTTAIEQTLVRYNALSPDRALTAENISDTLNKTRGQRLEGMASIRNTTLYLKDLVLSEQIRSTLAEILSYARYSEMVMNNWGFAKYNASGAGLSVLLSGVPGTGKTLTALVLAHELGRALYVVDLSRVVDKYIGETEKKLSMIFDEAERSQAMLLFDEADSLFSKRTNVKSSNDRYANLEVNYLLQRLEAYRGVTLLTTNFADGLDEALARRIQFKIDFPMPDVKLRHELWKKLLPPEAPLEDDLDLQSIAEEFEMSGGHVKNAIFRASIQAAAAQKPLSHDMLWDAAVHEYRSMGHIIRGDYDEDSEIPEYRFDKT